MTREKLFHLSTTRPPVDEAVDWELEHHVQERIDELIAEGCTPAAAEEAARRAFGDIARVRQEMLTIDYGGARRHRAAEVMDMIAQDIKSAWRNITTAPGVAAAIILTLALGMGANTALFSVIDALLLRPLPYRASEELVKVDIAARNEPYGIPYVPFEIADRFRSSAGLFDASFVHTRNSGLFTGGTEPTIVALQGVSHEFEEVLGVRPSVGRGFNADDTQPGAPNVAVLSNALWQSAFGGDSAVLGQPVAFNGVQYSIIGVMPPRFKFPEYSTTEAWIALRTDGTGYGERPAAMVNIVGRVPVQRQAQASAQSEIVGAALLKELDPAGDQVARIGRLEADRARNPELRRGVWLAGGASLLIVIIAGVNMLNLLLVRATARTQEIAVRIALGAARTRLIRQLATEAMLLALLGGVGAVVFALLALRFVRGIIPSSIVFFAPHAIVVEQRTLLFTFVVATLTGLVFGLLPALRATGWADPASRGALTRYAGRTPSARRLRSVLVGTEVAVSVVLLAGAGLLINSFVRLLQVDPGIELDNLAVVEFQTYRAGRPEGPRDDYLRSLEERIEAIPGVRGATMSAGLPPSSSFSFGIALEAEGTPPRPDGNPNLLPFAHARPDFFDVTGARLLLGRAFNNTDTQESGNVIVDEDLARHLWGEENPAGKRFRLGAQSRWLTVVGVMADISLMGPDDREGNFELLYPAALHGDLSGQLTLAIRTERDPAELLPAIRAAIRDVNPNQAIIDIDTARRLYVDAIDMPRFLVALISTLALLALTLAAVGQYGLLAHGVEQRRQELALRVALGARNAHVRGLVIREALTLVTVGTAIGVIGALLASRILQSTLFGVEPNDPLTLAIVVATIFAVAMLATALPAWRATSVSPLEAMRVQ